MRLQSSVAAAAAKGSFAATDAVKKKKKKKGNKEAFQPLGLAVAERRSLPEGGDNANRIQSLQCACLQL